MAGLADIDHFVVLMLENRSFDNLLGWLYPGRADYEGLKGDEANTDAGGNVIRVWPRPDYQAAPAGASTALQKIPTPDPGEAFTDINRQLFGRPDPAPGDQPDLSGFAANYASAAGKEAGNPVDIMHCFLPGQVPALSALARSYAVCDHWYAAAPCQTWPNRFFVHTGTANGYENNSPVHFPYDMNTVFNVLDGQLPHGWEVYFHDFPQALTLSKLWDHLDHFRPFEDFLNDAQLGQLPSYAFIEPRYFADLDWPNDMHPPHDVGYGDRLVATVYNALVGSPAWPKTMLIVIFDEHGGCYDHERPPAATPPEPPRAGQVFGFDRYGVRVPAIIASPLIRPGTVFCADATEQPFDHTSVISTLRKRFGVADPLTGRDRRAPDLERVLALAVPDLTGREAVQPLPLPPEDDADALAAARLLPLNDFQQAMYSAAAHLAPLMHGVAVADHVASLDGGLTPVVDAVEHAADALPLIKNIVGRLLS